MAGRLSGTYVGQVERDPNGGLWAILYRGVTLISRERVASLRKGRRRVADLVLGAAETVVGLTGAFKPMADKRGLYVPNTPAAKPAPAAVL